MRRNFAASYQRAQELIAVGCPLDYPDALAPRRKPFHVEQLAGYVESRVYAIGPMQTGYVIGLRLWTDAAQIVIAEWDFAPPWENHLVSWNYDPRDIIPENHLAPYESVLHSRLRGILDEHHSLRRGYPVEGLLCGCSSQPIPESDPSVVGELIVQNHAGNKVALHVTLAIVREPARVCMYPHSQHKVAQRW